MDYGECPTCALGRSDYLVTLKPDIAAKLAPKQTESFDLEGNVVLGLYSVRTLEHAYTQGIARLPEEAFGDVDIYSDPEGFGFRAYRLAKEGEYPPFCVSDLTSHHFCMHCKTSY